MSHTDEPLSTRDLASREGDGAEPARPEERLRDERAGGAMQGEPLRDDSTGGAAMHEEPLRDDTTAGGEASAPPVGSGGEVAGGELAEHSVGGPAGRDQPADTGAEEGHGPLLAPDQGDELRRRWESLQTTFVDDPRRAVTDADGLVAGVMQQLAEEFARERERLESQWSRGEDVSTEDLRVALQRYRSFFHRLLSA